MALEMYRYDPFFVTSFKAHATTAIALGDMVQLASSVILPLSAVTDDATFVGISLGVSRGAADAGREIPVAQVCICRADLTSASYTFGAGLKWASASSLVADSDANTIGWFYDAMLTGQTITEGLVLFNVPFLCANADKLYHTVSA